jgi:hypothetical protein
MCCGLESRWYDPMVSGTEAEVVRGIEDVLLLSIDREVDVDGSE